MTYGWIVGSGDWLYTAYIGLWYLAGATQQMAIWSNALLAAFLPAAAFGIALALGASCKAALAAGVLGLLHPSSGVNASWLLKDTLAAFLAMGALWSALHLWRGSSWMAAALFALTVALLSSTRIVAFLALSLGTGLVILVAWRRAGAPRWPLVTSLLAAWLGAGMLYQAPQGVSTSQASSVSQMLTVPLLAVSGGLETVQAEAGEPAADETTLRWKAVLRDNLPLAVVKSVAHTLFAPYPWVAIHPGLTWRSFSELYYPGVLLWIGCLPGIFWAVAMIVRRRDPLGWTVLLFLGGLLAAYTLFQGEWSTRQRVFALPAFFALATIGWSEIRQRLRRRRTSAADTAG